MEDYQTQLAQEGSYRTTAHPPPPWSQQLLGRRLSFYAHYGHLVYTGVKLAKAGRYDDRAWAGQAWTLIKIIERHGGRFEIEGLHNLRDRGAMVFAANHMSTLETQVLAALISPFCPVTFVVKESLTRGFYAPLITSRPHIAVGRKDPFKDLERVLGGGKKILEQGRSVVIFPQATREPDSFTPRRFNSLATKLAATSGYPLVPVALKTDFWGAGQLIKDFGPIRPERPIKFAFGAPLSVDGKGREQQKEVVDFIRTHLKAWGAVVHD